jgi:hypothetical protein
MTVTAPVPWAASTVDGWRGFTGTGYVDRDSGCGSAASPA